MNLGARPAPRPGPGAAARAAGRARAGRVLLVERGPALRRQRHAAAGDRRGLAHARRGRGRADARRRIGAATAMPSDRAHERRRCPEPIRRDRRGRAPDAADRRSRSLTREWLVTNGLGGYASGTVAGVPTRRYHGLLIAALPAPLGRIVMLNHLAEQLRLPDGTDRPARRRGADAATRSTLPGAGHLAEFRLEAGLPVWRYEVGGVVLEKRRAPAAPAEHRARHLPAARGRRRRCGWSCGPSRPLPRRTTRRSTRRSAAPYVLTRRRRTATRSRRRPHLPPLRLTLARRATPPSPSTPRDARRTSLPRRGEPRLRVARATCGARATSGADLQPGEDAVTLVASTEPLGDVIAR